MKYGLIALAVIGVLFGAYEYGHSSGYDSGHTDAWNEQQKTIQKMVNQQNAQTSEQNAKISDLEQKGMKAAGDVFVATAQAAQTRSTIITKYEKATPQQVQQACGWDAPTVQTINELIDADPINKAANDYDAAHPIAATPASSAEVTK